MMKSMYIRLGIKSGPFTTLLNVVKLFVMKCIRDENRSQLTNYCFQSELWANERLSLTAIVNWPQNEQYNRRRHFSALSLPSPILTHHFHEAVLFYPYEFHLLLPASSSLDGRNDCRSCDLNNRKAIGLSLFSFCSLLVLLRYSYS